MIILITFTLLQMDMRIIAFIGLLILFINWTSGQDPNSEMKKAEKGIEAGIAILSMFDSDYTTKFVSYLGKVSKAISPFLGALGPVLSLVTLFLPKTPSDKMKNITKQFAEIDGHFDHVFNKFGEVKNLIKKTSLKNQYGQYQRSIIAVSEKLKDLINATKDTADDRKNMFLVASKCDANEAITVLLRYMFTEGSFSDNIPKAAMEYTNFNRRKVQKLIKGMLSLITQGVKINLANTKLVHKKAT